MRQIRQLAWIAQKVGFAALAGNAIGEPAFKGGGIWRVP
jgi:hypothetical protein